MTAPYMPWVMQAQCGRYPQWYSQIPAALRLKTVALTLTGGDGLHRKLSGRPCPAWSSEWPIITKLMSVISKICRYLALQNRGHGFAR